MEGLNLEQVLAQVIQSLASFFGQTTETIAQHAPEWLAKYGWYSALSDLGGNVSLGAIIGFAAAAIMFGIIVCIGVWDSWEEVPKGLKRLLWIVPVFVIICFAVIPLIPCFVAPEIVGLEAVIELIKGL